MHTYKAYIMSAYQGNNHSCTHTCTNLESHGYDVVSIGRESRETEDVLRNVGEREEKGLKVILRGKGVKSDNVR